MQKTNNGKKGGTLVGPSHKEGGIPVVVANTGQAVEVEGGEVIINKHAAALHKEELSRINQSAGGGVPIMANGGEVAKEAREHAGTFLKIKKGEIKTATQLGASIAHEHHAQKMGAGGTCGCQHKMCNGGNICDGKCAHKMEEGGIAGEEGSSTGTGSLYEFFTPAIVAKKMWDLAYKYGFNPSGRVLEPAVGNGRLIEDAPDKSKVTAFEINPDNIAALKKKFPGVTVYDKGFETAFLQEPRFNSRIKSKTKPSWLIDKGGYFDLVIANPPYGKFTGFYASYFNYKTQFEHWFVEYSMDLVAVGGLGVFLIPSSFMRNGNTYTSTKERIFSKCELLDAYRLPANIFAKTQIGTDIIVLKKTKQ